VNRIFDIEANTKEGHGVDGLTSVQELEAKHGRLPDTLMAESPSGSIHRIYRHPGRGIRIKSSSSELAPGVDIKGDGGVFVAPPSVRADGEYRWLNNLPIAEAPPWLIDLVSEPVEEPHEEPVEEPGEEPHEEPRKNPFGSREEAWAEAALRNVAGELRDTPVGKRNRKLYNCAFRLGTMVARGWIKRTDVERELEAAAKDCGLVDDTKGGGRRGVRATIKSGLDDGLEKPHEDLETDPPDTAVPPSGEKLPMAVTSLEPATSVAQRLGRSVRTIERWVKAGILPPPMQVNGRNLHRAGVMPKPDDA
jgi:hypothetical protein